eukprot:TRINITY_DN2593_c0_g1_i3.p1 TRINITY_DN2593_c0_g1~~TRINITY_DN2593_c0_g1_i3.p1  ORF type:complete len:407 (+),score=57.20 TRINITY_DN2593_c0_g1_i3:91-1311(+)
MKAYLFVVLFWVAASQGYFLQWFYENTDCTGSPYRMHINTTMESDCAPAGSNGYTKTFCNGDSISIKTGCPSCAATESQCTLNRPDTCFTKSALNSDNQPIQVGMKFTCQRNLPDMSIKQTYSGALLVADGYGARPCSGVAPIHNYYFKGYQCFQATTSSSFKVSCAGGAYSVTQHTGINCRGSGGAWDQAQCDESFTFNPSGPNTLQTLDCSNGSPTPSIGTIGSYLGGTTNPANTGPGAAGSATTTADANTNTNTNGGQPDSTVAGGPAAASTAGQNSQTTGPGGNTQTSGGNNVGSNTGPQSVTTGSEQNTQTTGPTGPAGLDTNTATTNGATGAGPVTGSGSATVDTTLGAVSGTTNSPAGSGTSSGSGNNATGSSGGVSSASILEVSAIVIICGAVVSWVV